jgi:hypothetical protein
VGRVSRVQEMVLVLGKVGTVLLEDVLALFPISFIFFKEIDVGSRRV